MTTEGWFLILVDAGSGKPMPLFTESLTPEIRTVSSQKQTHCIDPRRGLPSVEALSTVDGFSFHE